ncbi:hypothetical protein EWI07_02680 [Sporolactobacillus sp. THM7-4]|nr:hypothetical protein EWI07_02680 [Sporolactobacillus sp. THM7-4]
MPSIRQDAWSHAEDVKLAETVLRHISEGSTQLAAFVEAGNLLSRTPAACGFRWNSSVRKQYETKLREAKERRREERKLKKKQKMLQGTEIFAPGREPGPSFSEQTIDQLILFLKQMKAESSHPGFSEDIKSQLEQLKAENQALDQAYRKLEREYIGIKRNYDSLLHVLKMVDQARKQIPIGEERELKQELLLETKEN